MRMMMEVTEYVELPNIAPTRAAFAEALYLAQGVFGVDAVEWGLPSLVFNRLLRITDEGLPLLRLVDNTYQLVGLPLALMYQQEHVRLVFKTETLGVSCGQ